MYQWFDCHLPGVVVSRGISCLGFPPPLDSRCLRSRIARAKIKKCCVSGSLPEKNRVGRSVLLFSSPVRKLASASALLKMLKFLVKVFMSLYLLKLWMDQVDTLHVGRYWSEVLCCTIMTHLGDLEVKVTDLKILCLSFWLKFL